MADAWPTRDRRQVTAEFPEGVAALKDKALKRAMAQGDERCKQALAAMHGFSEKTIMGVVALCTAAAVGDVEAVRTALTAQHGPHPINVNDRDYHGATAMHVAAAKGFASVVSLLIDEFGADATVVDDAGVTPLQAAV